MVEVSYFLVLRLVCFLAPHCCFLTTPSWVWTWSHSLTNLRPTGALVCWAAIYWVCQTLPTEAPAELRLRQGRQKALGLRWVLKPAQPNSGPGNPRPGLRSELSAQGRACGPLLGMTKIYSSRNIVNLTPGNIFSFFLFWVSFLLFHAFIPLKWSRAQQKWII